MLHPYAQAQKVDQDLPNAYGMTVYLKSGLTETFEVASHAFAKEPERLEFVTHDNKWNNILWDVISRLEFDKRFSRILEIAEKKKKQKEKK